LKTNEQIKSPTGKRLVGLLIGVLVIVVFLFWVGPWLERLPLFHPVAELIKAQDIDAGAYYYTDIKEFADAEFNINQAMIYPPERKP
jgi:hypothetical protein